MENAWRKKPSIARHRSPPRRNIAPMPDQPVITLAHDYASDIVWLPSRTDPHTHEITARQFLSDGPHPQFYQSQTFELRDPLVQLPEYLQKFIKTIGPINANSIRYILLGSQTYETAILNSTRNPQADLYSDLSSREKARILLDLSNTIKSDKSDIKGLNERCKIHFKLSLNVDGTLCNLMLDMRNMRGSARSVVDELMKQKTRKIGEQTEKLDQAMEVFEVLAKEAR